MYHVCHKCGLPRTKDKTDADIGWCGCIGQTWFEYEELERTEVEAREIARVHYGQRRELYARQELRTPYDYVKLDAQYRKALEI